MLPGEWGLAGVTINLTEYSPSDPSTIVTTLSRTTGSGGYYDFSGLPTGGLFSVTEVQPSNYFSTANSVGQFLSATGATLAVPTGVGGNPANGMQDTGNPFALSSIYLPSPIGAFAPGGDGVVYSAVDYNFGQFPTTLISGGSGTSKLSITPSVPGTSGRPRRPLEPCQPRWRSRATTIGSWRGRAAEFLACRRRCRIPRRWAPAPSTGKLPRFPRGSAYRPLLPCGARALLGMTCSLRASMELRSLPARKTRPSRFPARFRAAALVGGSTTSAVIDPVSSRGIDAVTAVSFGRVMQGGIGSATFTVSSTGSHDTLSDLAMNAASVTGAGVAGNFTATNGGPVLFNGSTTTSPALTVSGTFFNSITGPVSDGVLLPGNAGLFTGEVLASGTAALPSLVLPYTATVLEPRSLQPVTGGGIANAVAVPTTGGGLLYGAVVALPNSYLVTSANDNPDSDHTSMVNVPSQTANSVSTSDGTTQVGKVTASQTTFSSGGAQAVGLSIEADQYGPTSGIASLNVMTAEADSVHDNTAYAPISVFYSISNVGYAAVGGANPVNPQNQQFGAPLSGSFAAGSHLSSRVAATGSAGSNSVATGYDGSTLSQASLVNASNVTGTVGSECDVIGGPTMSGSSMITMAWRARNADENGSAFVNGNPASTNPANVGGAGVPALASDIAEIGGVPSATAFAIQVSYDDRINTFPLGMIEPDAAPGRGRCISGVALVNSKWVNAMSPIFLTGGFCPDRQLMSLEWFWSPAPRWLPFDERAPPSWGVDTTNHESWAIVNNGGGDFAVAEPRHRAYAAAAGCWAYRARRRPMV